MAAGGLEVSTSTGESSFLSKTPSVLEVGKQALNADHPSHTLLKKFTCIMIEEVSLFRQ